jgi:hypothetical protein
MTFVRLDSNPLRALGLGRDATEKTKKAGVERFLFASSCSLYGKSGDEEMHNEAPRPPPWTVRTLEVLPSGSAGSSPRNP